VVITRVSRNQSPYLSMLFSSSIIKKIVVGRYKFLALRILFATWIKIYNRDLIFYLRRWKEIAKIRKTLKSKEVSVIYLVNFPEISGSISFGDSKIVLNESAFSKKHKDTEISFFLRRFSWLQPHGLSLQEKHDLVLWFFGQRLKEADVYSVGLRTVNSMKFVDNYPELFSENERQFLLDEFLKSYLFVLYNYEFHFKWTNNHFFSNLSFLVEMEAFLELSKSKALARLLVQSLKYVFNNDLSFREESSFYFFLITLRLFIVHERYPLLLYQKYLLKIYPTVYKALVLKDQEIICLGDVSPDMTGKALLVSLEKYYKPQETDSISDYLNVGPFTILINGQSSLIISNSNRGSHSHDDFGHVIIRNQDRVLLDDLGRDNYIRTNKLSTFQISSVAHNYPLLRVQKKEISRKNYREGRNLFHIKYFYGGSKIVRKTEISSLIVSDSLKGDRNNFLSYSFCSTSKFSWSKDMIYSDQINITFNDFSEITENLTSQSINYNSKTRIRLYSIIDNIGARITYET